MIFDFDFDEIIDRRGTGAVAQHGFRDYLFGGQDPVELPCDDDDAISMWVADMAFASAPAAREAMVERVESQAVFGYSAVFGDELFSAFADWCTDHYGWAPDREHFLTSSGIVPALYDLVEHIIEDGQKVLTLTPAYGFFKHAPEYHDRELVTCSLIEDEQGNYTVDFDDFAVKVSDPDLRLFFLCHPHNPTGRVWTDDELRTMADLCFANDVIVVSDEIHCDLLRSGITHTPLAKLYPESDQIITCMSTSKTFNLAGLSFAFVMIPNDDIRAIWIDRNSPLANPVSTAAAIGVLRKGGDWHRQLREYLDENFRVAKALIDAELPDAVFNIPDATYLGWLDLRAYFDSGTNLTRHFAEAAGVLLEGGDMFIADADGHVRINLACPRSVLEEGLRRVITAVPAAVA